MDIHEKAAFSASIKDLSVSRENDPYKFLESINNAAAAALDARQHGRDVSLAGSIKALAESKENNPSRFLDSINRAATAALDLRQIEKQNVPTADKSQEKAQYAEPGRVKSTLDPTEILRAQMSVVEQTAKLVERLERAGYPRPETNKNWVSEMLSSHQRGYMQSDIFTEAVVGLVWIAAKVVDKAIMSPEKGKDRSSVLDEVKIDLAKISKAVENQLAATQYKEMTGQRHGVMEQAISRAGELRRDGQHVKADKTIASAFQRITAEARQQRMSYDPKPEHQAHISGALSREKELASVPGKTAAKSLDRLKESIRDQGLGL